MEKIIIIGNGGHAKSIADAIERKGLYRIMGYVVNDDAGDMTGEYPVIGKDRDLKEIFRAGICNAVLGIGFLGKGSIREQLYNTLKEIGYSLPAIIDLSAVVSQKSSVGEGSFIGKGAIINVNASVGKGCIINTGAIIEHDCVVGDFSHIAVGSVLCGNVMIGCSTLVGANATVIQGRHIGDNCIIGAGEVLKETIKDNTIYRNLDFRGGV